MTAIQTILHPTDFSAHSRCAFDMACRLACDLNARLIVLHVFPMPFNHAEALARRPPDAYEDLLWNELEKLQSPDPSLRIDYRLLEGNAANEINRMAFDLDCDLIVMGTHGRTGLSRLLMGSVAEHVVRQAPCPVVTVRLPQLKRETAKVTELAGAI